MSSERTEVFHYFGFTYSIIPVQPSWQLEPPMIGSGTLRKGRDADGGARWDPADPLRPVVDVFNFFAVVFEVMSSLALTIFIALVTLATVTLIAVAVAVILMLLSL